MSRSIAGSASVSASAEAHHTGSRSSASSTTARCGPSTTSASRALVSSASVTPRSSRSARSMRTPDQTATGRGGRHAPSRRGGIEGARRRSVARRRVTPRRAEPSWATGRPWLVTIVRSPAVGTAHRVGQCRAQLAHPLERAACVSTCVHNQICARFANRTTLRRMNFAFTEEQEELRKTVRAFLEAKSPESAVREQMETEAGYDAAVWSQMAEQMGLQGLHIPEEYGGSGFGYVELGIVLEEMGRALLCAPFFSSVVLAANTLHPVGRRGRQAGLPAGHRQRRDDRHRSRSPSRRASGTRPASRCRPPPRVTATPCRAPRASCSTVTPPT